MNDSRKYSRGDNTSVNKQTMVFDVFYAPFIMPDMGNKIILDWAQWDGMGKDGL